MQQGHLKVQTSQYLRLEAVLSPQYSMFTAALLNTVEPPNKDTLGTNNLSFDPFLSRQNDPFLRISDCIHKQCNNYVIDMVIE